MFPLLLLALIVVPIVEIYVIVQVGGWLGVLPTVALLLALSIGGGLLLKREGTRAWRSLRQSLAAGRWPGRDIADGALILVGGTLLLTPGFVTDAFGLLLVLPPTRAVFRGLLTRVLLGRLGVVGEGVTQWQELRDDHERRERRRRPRPPDDGSYER